MGRKSSCPPEQPVQPPPSPDCGCEPDAPPAGHPGAPGLDLSGVLGILPNISIAGDAGAIASGTGISAILPVDISLVTNEASEGGLDIELSPIEVGTPSSGGDDGRPLLSLDSETEASIAQVPVFGEDGILSGGTNLGGVVGGDGAGADIGSLLNAAMLDVGNGGALGAITGGEAYDGNVPLAGDLASALGSTLDLLTTTSSLFDVPALDILGCDGMDG